MLAREITGSNCLVNYFEKHQHRIATNTSSHPSSSTRSCSSRRPESDGKLRSKLQQTSFLHATQNVSEAMTLQDSSPFPQASYNAPTFFLWCCGEIPFSTNQNNFAPHIGHRHPDLASIYAACDDAQPSLPVDELLGVRVSRSGWLLVAEKLLSASLKVECRVLDW